MKVYCIFSGYTYEPDYLMHIVTTKEEAERVVAAYKAEYKKDIEDGEAFGGHIWWIHEEELLEKIDTPENYYTR